MEHRVRIAANGHEFSVADGETVLAAALRQGIVLPYSCRSGSCGSCKARILGGEVEHQPFDPQALGEDERAAGSALLCRAVPRSALEIEVREVKALESIEVVTLPCRVVAMQRLAHDVMQLTLRTPRSHSLRYLPGQYIDLLLDGGRRRSYSLANAPRDDGLLELHIRHVPGGRFTDHLFHEMQVKALLRFQGPLGTFIVNQGSDAPLVFMAGGTGFAPIKAMLEQLLGAGINRPVQLFHGVRARRDLYSQELAEDWARRYPDFRYTPVLSEPDPDDGWSGATGYVHQQVLREYPDLSGYEVYAAGPPVMVEAGRKAFPGQGLASESYYYDSFEYKKD